jgi:hypothetical protein
LDLLTFLDHYTSFSLFPFHVIWLFLFWSPDGVLKRPNRANDPRRTRSPTKMIPTHFLLSSSMVRIVVSLVSIVVFNDGDWEYSGCVVMYQSDDVGEKVML